MFSTACNEAPWETYIHEGCHDEDDEVEGIPLENKSRTVTGVWRTEWVLKVDKTIEDDAERKT